MRKLITRLYHWILSLNMCKCVEPEYEVINKILCCRICRKPVKWEYQPQPTKETAQ